MEILKLIQSNHEYSTTRNSQIQLLHSKIIIVLIVMHLNFLFDHKILFTLDSAKLTQTCILHSNVSFIKLDQINEYHCIAEVFNPNRKGLWKKTGLYSQSFSMISKPFF